MVTGGPHRGYNSCVAADARPPSHGPGRHKLSGSLTYVV